MDEIEEMIEEMEVMFEELKLVQSPSSVFDMICLLSLKEGGVEYRPFGKIQKFLNWLTFVFYYKV